MRFSVRQASALAARKDLRVLQLAGTTKTRGKEEQTEQKDAKSMITNAVAISTASGMQKDV